MKHNIFYTDFDTERITPEADGGYRTPFQQDRDRIIHSGAFRRLQSKTQVFISGEYDFYRTRLTHSIEVAQIGRSICNYLKATSPHLSDTYYIDPDLVEAACLAHDLGHPPFGHAGERTLHKLMRDYGGFEGNAQTLRVITQTIFSSTDTPKGMNPTRAFMDSTMKYKTLLHQTPDAKNHFLYDEQEPYLAFVFDGDLPSNHFSPGKALNEFRSIECQIMDWADDTAYSLMDIVDGIHARFITLESLENWAANASLNATEQKLLRQLMRVIREGDVEHVFARKIGDYISACQLEPWENYMSAKSNRYRFKLQIDKSVQTEARFFKKVAVELVFKSPQLHQLEYKWNFLLEKLFRAYSAHYLAAHGESFKLLPENTHRLVVQAATPAEKARIICDHIASMTDGFAIRTTRRLYDPDFGSIVDLI